jgi:hypothetical protein
MRQAICSGIAILCVIPALALGQESTKRFENYQKPSAQDFVKSKPTIGDSFPALTIYSPDGKEFQTDSLKGQYTLVTLGCLTCPPFLGNVPGLEAVYRDYAPKGVKFYFVYRAVAHPELRGNYLQTFTLDERLAHARQAGKQLGSSIPFLVDHMDNRLKHALGGRANCDYLIDPDGKVVRKRMWSNPAEVRKDLEELVGKVDPITKPEDLRLKVEEPLAETAPRGFVERLPRAGMWPVVMDPQMEKGAEPFYAKLRAEADLSLIDTGKGKLYVGFHLDPFYSVHWNKLNKPLRFELTLPEGAKFSKTSGQAQAIDAESDCDPREFMIDVESWPEGKAVTLTVAYAACSEKDCHLVRQEYVLHRERDIDGGRAAPAGFRGAMTLDAMLAMLMEGDKNGDGKLAKQELNSIQRKSFAEHDQNGDGLLDKEEIKAMAEEAVRFLPKATRGDAGAEK